MAPVLVSSVHGSDVIGWAFAVMMLLSFPSSLLAAPLMMFVNLSIGFHPISIEGQYLNLILLFAVGVLQWFWIAPRMSGEDSRIEPLKLVSNGVQATFPRPIPGVLFSPFDAAGRTPVERLIEHDGETKV